MPSLPPAVRVAAVAIALAPAIAIAPPAQGRRALAPEHAVALAKIQPKINEAIDKGIAYLLKRQLRDGSWAHDEQRFRTGQTALAAYTLMKSGLPPEHSAVQRALAFLRTMRPTMVYAAGCQLLAFSAAGHSFDIEHIEEITKAIVRLQEGTWGYPNNSGRVGGLHSDRDLSITLFALFGMHAATRAGVKVPRRAWAAAHRDVPEYQESPRPIDGKREAAGFRYRWAQRSAPTGSMTTAGVSALALLRDLLEVPARSGAAREIDRAIELGMNWLDHHWTLDKNPGHTTWQYYYIYGIERTGSLLGTEYVGEHPWYLEGAKKLIGWQKKQGHWHQRDSESDTCFALLFLSRATAPTTGKNAVNKNDRAHEAPESPFGWRTIGGDDGSPLRMWITRIGAPDGKEPHHVTAVEYTVDDVVVARIDGDPTRPRRSEESFVASHTFDRRGTYRIGAKLHLRDPGTGGRAEPEDRTLAAKPVELAVDHVLEPWMLPAASATAGNRLQDTRVETKASSAAKNHPARQAADGLEFTAWVCEATDEKPTLIVYVPRPQRANTLVIGQAIARREGTGQYDRITAAEVRINGGTPFVVTFPEDEVEPAVIALERTQNVRKIQIRITERAQGKQHKGKCGIAEVGVELR